MSADWTEMFQLEGRGFISDTYKPSVKWLDHYIYPEDRETIVAAITDAIEHAKLFELEHRVRRVDGTPGWTHSRAIPRLDEEGKIVDWFGIAADITGRRETAERLQASEQQYRLLFESIDEGFCTVELIRNSSGRAVDYRFLQVNPAFARQTGLAGATGKTMRELAPSHEEFWFETYGKIAASGQAERFEHAAGELDRWFDVFAFPIGEADSNRLAILFRDISDRKQADETQQLLLGELNHRVKNTLATVQSIVQMTLRHTREPKEFAKAFSGRVQSLSRVHSILTEATWEGADLRGLIHDQLLSGVMEKSQLQVSGPDVRLPPQIALHLALMLHELGTNASKYGALTLREGSVNLQWSIRNEMLELNWAELGGPPVRVPSRRGFGSTLIEQTAKSSGGTAQVAFEEAGVKWEIRLPLPIGSTPVGKRGFEAVRKDKFQTAAGVAEPEPTTLTGCRLLVVEDEPLLAMDSTSALEGAGASVTGVAGTVKEALKLIETGDYDAAVLDANLQGLSVDEVAASLARRNIPFVFVSGYGVESLPRAFASTPLLNKPFSYEDLVKAVDGVVRRPKSVSSLR